VSNEFCGSFGINSKLGFAASGAINAAPNAPTSRLEILAENFNYADQLIGGRGLTGSVNEITAHLRQGQRLVNGGFVCEVGPNEIAPFIRMICGNTAADQTKEKVDHVPFDFTVERDLVDHAYRYCLPQQIVIRGRSDAEDPEGQILQMAMQFMGVEEHGATFPNNLALPDTDRLYWLIGDSKLEVGSAEFPVIGFDITIRYAWRPLFRNQLKPGCFRSLGRQITVEVQVPFSPASSAALFSENVETDLVLSLAADNLPEEFSDYATVFTFPTVRRIEKNANTQGRGEIPLIATFKSYQKGSGTTMSITNTVGA
jgi:hypothetical protein